MAATLKLRDVYAVLEGHAGDVNSTAWSPVSKELFCSCCGDKHIRVWRIDGSIPPNKKPDPVETILAHKFYINSCAYNASGDLFATASSDDSVKLWSTASWSCVGELSFHDASVRGCCFSPDGNLLASASDDSKVCVWEVGSLRCITTISKHSDGVLCCRFAPNGWLLATGAANGQFLLFDAYTGTCVAKKRIGAAHDGSIMAIAVTPPLSDTPLENVPTSSGTDKCHFATAGDDCVVRIWRVECSNNGKRTVVMTMEKELTCHSGPVYSCEYHPTLPYLATGSRDKTVILWDIVSYERVCQVEAHSRYVTHVSFSPCGSFIATASNDRTVKVWTLSTATTVDNTTEEPGKASVEAVDSTEPSVISKAEWTVEGVCQWAESVAKQQNTVGAPVHPDDIRAAERLVGSLQQVSLTTEDRRKGNDDFKCPITCEVMTDPVVASDGYSYERSAITGWFSKGRRTSPVTNLPLGSTLLLPNRVLKIAIDRERKATK